MTQKKTTPKPGIKGDVSQFMEILEHPFKAQIYRLRALILELSPEITEAIKWKAPSFKLTEHFATFKLYPSHQLQLVLHRGAKIPLEQKQMLLDDPHHLLKWPAIDRCVLTLQSPEQADALEASVISMIQQWMDQL